MINETKQRIEAYKAALPGIKERIVAVAIMLAISVTMMASASYAWLTISTSPEVSGMSTTVTANGNLEIALAGLYDDEGNLLMPNESAVGDSSAAEGQNIVAANLTWGNLINLSDSSYGLQNMALRPALLYGYNLTKTPLYGAVYGEDGRVIGTSAKYEYASYTLADDGTTYFAAGDKAKAGVRAIASVTYKNITGTAIVNKMWENIDNAYATADARYVNIITGVTLVDENPDVSCMDALASVVELYVQDKANQVLGTGAAAADYSGVVTYTYRLMEEFFKVLEAEGQGLLYLANLQAYLTNNANGTDYFKDLDALLAAKDSELEEAGVSLKSLATYKTNRADMLKSIGELKPLAEACDPDLVTDPAPVSWSQISAAVNRLVKIETATIDGMVIGTLSSDDMGGLIDIITGNNINNKSEVILCDGVLADTEQRLGNHLDTKDVWLKIYLDVTYMIHIQKNVYAFVLTDATDAEEPFTSIQDREYTLSIENTGTGGDAVANDIYGMAIDMWVRTNVEGTFLTLEGNLDYGEREKTCTNKLGKETTLYMLSFEDSQADVYKMEEDGTLNWYYATTHTLIGSVEELTAEGYTSEIQMEEYVKGFSGENRVWEDWEMMLENELISEHSTTQGNGSCYVFYADNETDQVRILNMLKAFTVVFLDQSGTKLATARLDTENAYIINGKVTVPLKMTAGVTYVDETGEECIGIKALDCNTPTWITAVIYLDGLNLRNEDVLAVGEIEGSLNLQYGSSTNLTSMEDKELQKQYRIVSATAASAGQTSAQESSPITFNYDGTAKTVTVTLSVDGTQPSTVSAFFVRTINSKQGARGATKVFTKNTDGTWSATFDLTKPGSYSLRSVIVDGVDYPLEDCPTVQIDGFDITNVHCSLAQGITMTADNYIEATVTAEINADENLLPSQVRAKFRSKEGKEFTAVLSYNSTTEKWEGTAKITESGTYTLGYIAIDGDDRELADAQKSTHIIYLGLSAKVWTDHTPLKAEYKGPVYDIDMQVKLYDDSGNEIQAQEYVELRYHKTTSILDNDGMYARVYWNPQTGYYEGVFSLRNVGTYVFDRVDVTSNGVKSSIYSASVYPVFEAYTTDPPVYVGNATDDYQFIPNGETAQFAVKLKDADTAVVYALVEDKDGNTVLVECPQDSAYRVGSEDGYTYFYFDVPENTTGAYSGTQDGDWQIVALYFQNAADPNKNWYPETEETPTTENSYVIELIEESIVTYVVETVNMKISGENGEKLNGTVDLGMDPSGNITSVFMDTHTVKNVIFTLTDWNNKPINGTATWEITYEGGQKDKGGYTGGNYSGASPAVTANNGVYTSASTNLRLAGVYQTTFTVTADGVTTSYPNVLTYQVWSVKPEVTVSATSPNGQVNAFTGYSYGTTFWGSSYVSAVNTTPYTAGITNNGKTANVCFVGTGSTINNNLTHPSVTLSLSGIGSATKAVLSFGSDALVRTKSGNAAASLTGTYEWTSDTTCRRYIGTFNSQTGNDNRTAAGTITANELVLHCDVDGNGVAETYTVTIDTITINNPY